MTDQAAPASQAWPVPKEQLLDLLFGMALLEQHFTGEQAAAYLRQVQAARLPLATTARMADRAEENSAGIQVWRERAAKLSAERTTQRVTDSGSDHDDTTLFWSS